MVRTDGVPPPISWGQVGRGGTQWKSESWLNVQVKSTGKRWLVLPGGRSRVVKQGMFGSKNLSDLKILSLELN